MAFKLKHKNGEGIESSLTALRGDLSALQEHVSELVGEIGGAASLGVTSAVHSAASAAENVVEQAEDLGQDGVDVVRKKIRAQPLVSCAVSVGAGALIGALLARQ